MSSAIAVYEQPNLPKSMASISAERTALRNLMKDHMKEGVHYLTIPGTPKPTLTKPGSELILSMLHIAAEPIVDDLSTPDEMRYRVFVQLTEMGSGRFLGKGVGEASSAETKYAWRAIVCQEEFDTTPEDHRRVIFKKGYQGGNPTRVFQVRTCKEDVANTILKMSKKRAQIDATLTVSACSDLFMQDAEEVIAAGLEFAEDAPQQGQPAQRTIATLQPKAQQQQAQAQPRQRTDSESEEGDGDHRNYFSTQKQAQPAQQAARPQQSGGGATISEPQARRFWVIATTEGGKTAQDVNAFVASIGLTRKEDMPRSQYEAACDWARKQ